MSKEKQAKIGEADPKDEMSFLDHLEVLRWHIIRSMASVMVFAIAFFALGKTVFEKIIFAPLNPQFVSYKFFCWLSNASCLKDPKLELIRKEFKVIGFYCYYYLEF